MKLDKRACRHAANVPLHISLNAGVLYTERVKYLVTAAVKLLGGHRVLTVYFYDCERLKTNDRIQKRSIMTAVMIAQHTGGEETVRGFLPIQAVMKPMIPGRFTCHH